MSTNQGELGNWEECTGQVNEWMNEYSRHASLGTNITIPSESEDVLISSMQKTKNSYEIFIQETKGYKIIGPMRAQGDTYLVQTSRSLMKRRSKVMGCKF
jgi:hypothetical protein